MHEVDTITCFVMTELDGQNPFLFLKYVCGTCEYFYRMGNLYVIVANLSLFRNPTGNSEGFD